MKTRTTLARLLHRRQTWQDELDRGGRLAASAPRIIAELDVEIANLRAKAAGEERAA